MSRNRLAERKGNYPEFKEGFPEFKSGSQFAEFGNMNTMGQRGGGGGIPFASDAFEVWDYRESEIIAVGENKYFKGKNGHNLLITGYDFEAGWNKGFLYKSEATVSAPAGDSAFIAVDRDNFWYNSGGNPNQIPVIALYQNVDYANWLYSKHYGQSVDYYTQVETYEPRVWQTVLYNNPKTGEDAVRCNSYYSVPTEDLNAIWVTQTGDNTTGNGSKVNPYLTIGKANTVSAGKTVYVKTGVYSENSITTFNLLLDKNNSRFIATGLTEVRGASSDVNLVYLYGANTISFEGFIVNSQSTQQYGIKLETANKSVKRCKSLNSTNSNYAIYANNIIENCISGAATTSSIRVYTGGARINTCLFDRIFGASSATVAVNHCRIALTLGNCSVTTGHLSMFDNKVEWKVADKPFIGGTYNLTLNRNIIKTALNLSVVPIVSQTASSQAINISNNVFEFTGATMSSTSIIQLINQVDPIVENNICLTATEAACAFVRSTGDAATVLGTHKVNSNVIFSKSLNGYCIGIGNETTGIADNKIIAEVTKNIVYGPLFYDNTKTGATHSIFVGHNIDPIVKYNKIIGGLIGIVIKHTGGVYASSVQYNLTENCIEGILLKGVNGLQVINNTVKSYINAITRGIRTETHTTQASNLVIKNNIIDITGASNSYAIFINNGSETGLVSNNNILYCPDGSGFSYQNANKTFTQWQALGFDTNSLDQTANLTAGLWPTTPISIGENLGTDYDDGLDITTNWGSATTVPNVVTKQQGANWQVGAYVQ